MGTDSEADDFDTIVPSRGRRGAVEPLDLEELEAESDSIRGVYRFRIGDEGETLILDHITYIGRNPSPPRISSESSPRLISVASPHKEVSSTHVELRQVGPSVVVTDMKSTNGTYVTIPGGAPRKLRQGESLVTTPGTVVDIGDGVLIEILPMRLIA